MLWVVGKVEEVTGCVASKDQRSLHNARILITVVSCGTSVGRSYSMQKLECMLNYGMRLILSKPPRTPSEDLRRTLKWIPLREKGAVSNCTCAQVCFTLMLKWDTVAQVVIKPQRETVDFALFALYS